MSGLEVIGVVLGSIPLIISALEHYRDGATAIKRFRRYDREKQSVVRNLKTERVKMQNVCEKLLEDLVAKSQIQAMTQNPFGQLWQEDSIKRKIRERLEESIEVFESIVVDIKDAILEMMKRLGLDSGENPQEKEKSFISKELQRATFAISRASYDDILTRIRNGISDLETLTDQSISLEPRRKESSQVKLLSLLRELSLGLYHALRQSLSCATCSNHTLNLELCSRPSDIMYGESEAKILKDLCMTLALSYSPSESERRRWEELRIEPLPALEPPPSPQLEPRLVDKGSVSPSRPKIKSVKFSFMSSSSGSAASSTLNLSQTTTTTSILSKTLSDTHLGACNFSLPQSELIEDLCNKVRSSQKRQRAATYGFIAGSEGDRNGPEIVLKRRYQVFPTDIEDGEDSDLWSTISLRQALRRKRGKSVPPLSYGDKLRLAVLIATGVLQLYNTPWLPHTLTSGDIFFIQKRYNHVYESVFMTTRLPDGVHPMDKLGRTSLGKPRDPTLLSLGFLLIELLLGETLMAPQEDSDEDTTSGKDIDLEETYIAAQNCLPRVRHESLNYFSAVSRCLDGELHRHRGDKNDPDFRQSIYSGIVALLKKDLEVL